jgi:hypothetical protein
VPKRVLPTLEQLENFIRDLEKIGFEQISDAEFKERLARLKGESPRPRFGRELGFKYSANGLAVVVWTTWLPELRMFRKKDSGWVLIEENDAAVYFSRPLRRTNNFLKNLYDEALIARERINCRPRCSECGAYMKIVPGRGLKSRYWRCRRLLNHQGGSAHSLPLNYGLSENMMRLVGRREKKQRRYLRDLKKEGKPIHLAMLQRKPWR